MERRPRGVNVTCMDALEIVDVAGADFQEIIEIAGYQMAIEHAFQLRGRLFEGGKALRRGTVEHDTDHVDFRTGSTGGNRNDRGRQYQDSVTQVRNY